MAFTPHSTFGAVAYIYNGSAYLQFSGLHGIDGGVPSLAVNAIKDVTNHGSASGVEEKITDGILKWSGPLVLDFYEDSASGAVTDPAMVHAMANVGVNKKFKVTLAGITAPLYWNAIIESVVQGPRPISGEATIKVTLVPTGVAPTS